LAYEWAFRPHPDEARARALLAPLLDKNVQSKTKYSKWGLTFERNMLVDHHLLSARAAANPEERVSHLDEADELSAPNLDLPLRAGGFTSFAHSSRSRVEAALGQPDAAIAAGKKAVESSRKACPNGWLCIQDLRYIVEQQADLLIRLQKPAEAEQLLAEPRGFLKTTFPDHRLPIHGLILQRLGHVQRLQGKHAAARQSLAEAKRRLESVEVPVPSRIKEIDDELAQVEAAMKSNPTAPSAEP
jgi:hypothetical protein